MSMRCKCPAPRAILAFCPKHAPFMAMLRAGTLSVENDGKTQHFELDGGFVDVTPEGVTVLAESIGE
jgi:F-type H+-transporting ATPase subunit epsilon